MSLVALLIGSRAAGWVSGPLAYRRGTVCGGLRFSEPGAAVDRLALTVWWANVIDGGSRLYG